jgi:hypothetical protein
MCRTLADALAFDVVVFVRCNPTASIFVAIPQYHSSSLKEIRKMHRPHASGTYIEIQTNTHGCIHVADIDTAMGCMDRQGQRYTQVYFYHKDNSSKEAMVQMWERFGQLSYHFGSYRISDMLTH